MHVVERVTGRSWTVYEGNRELGVVTLVRGGRHGLRMYAAYSATSEGTRWDLGSHASLDDAVGRVRAFDEDPSPFRRRVHRVSAETIEKRR